MQPAAAVVDSPPEEKSQAQLKAIPSSKARRRLEADTECKVCKKQENCKLCSRCGIRCYCCTDHQKQDWPRHKLECKAFQEAEKRRKDKLAQKVKRVQSQQNQPKSASTSQSNSSEAKSSSAPPISVSSSEKFAKYDASQIHANSNSASNVEQHVELMFDDRTLTSLDEDLLADFMQDLMLGKSSRALCEMLWKKYDVHQKLELEGDAAHEFVREFSDLNINTTLSEENLKLLFKDEFGDDVSLPPESFFSQQKDDLKRQLENDIWKEADPQRAGKISWTEFEKFFGRHFGE